MFPTLADAEIARIRRFGGVRNFVAGEVLVTGREAGGDRLPTETSRRGIFAIGDVRSGSVKRVASAAGDGSQAVFSIHNYFGERFAFLHDKG